MAIDSISNLQRNKDHKFEAYPSYQSDFFVTGILRLHAFSWSYDLKIISFNQVNFNLGSNCVDEEIAHLRDWPEEENNVREEVRRECFIN